MSWMDHAQSYPSFRTYVGRGGAALVATISGPPQGPKRKRAVQLGEVSCGGAAAKDIGVTSGHSLLDAIFIFGAKGVAFDR